MQSLCIKQGIVIVFLPRRSTILSSCRVPRNNARASNPPSSQLTRADASLRSFPPDLWKPTLRGSESRRLQRTGQSHRLITSAISTATFTDHPRKREQRLCGHALLGRGASSPRSISSQGDTGSQCARRRSPGYNRRSIGVASRPLGPARREPTGSGSPCGTNDTGGRAGHRSATVARIVPNWAPAVRATRRQRLQSGGLRIDDHHAPPGDRRGSDQRSSFRARGVHHTAGITGFQL